MRRSSIDASIGSLRTFVLDRAAYYLETDPELLDMDVPLAEYGLDSVFAFAVAGDIEDHFELTIDPTVIWDYPTVAAIAGHVHGLLNGGPA